MVLVTNFTVLAKHVHFSLPLTWFTGWWYFSNSVTPLFVRSRQKNECLLIIWYDCRKGQPEGRNYGPNCRQAPGEKIRLTSISLPGVIQYAVYFRDPILQFFSVLLFYLPYASLLPRSGERNKALGLKARNRFVAEGLSPRNWNDFLEQGSELQDNQEVV